MARGLLVGLTIVSLALAGAVEAATNVCLRYPEGVIVGPQNSDAVWTPTGSPYVVSCDLRVSRLTILPGVEVLFTDNVLLEVAGSLTAEGEPGAPIAFRHIDPAVEHGWQGIYLNRCDPRTIFLHCEIRGANSTALRIEASAPTIGSCHFEDNANLAGAGGAIESDSPLQLEDCTFRGNFSPVSGGAIHTTAKLVLDDCVFVGNVAKRGGGLPIYGGAVRSEGDVTADRCVFERNTVDNYNAEGALGGAVAVSGPYVATISNSVLRANTARSGVWPLARGSAVYVDGGSLTITNSIVTDNVATRGNGRDAAVYSAYGSARITNVIISHNSHAGVSGRESNVEIVNARFSFNGATGIWLAGTTTQVANTTLSDNGSGVYVQGGSARLTNVTVTHNRMDGILSSGNVEVANSIIYFNGTQLTGGGFDIRYSAIQGGFEGGVGNIDRNPIFTRDPFPRIAAGSPCIDAGDPDPAFDDACFPPSLGTPRNDMGAHGGPGACDWTLPTDCDGNGIFDAEDIADGRLPDCNSNGIPDTCEDPDGNGVLDDCGERVAFFEPLPGEALCFDLVVRSDVPFRGGELAVGVDPGLLSITSAAVAPDAPAALAGASEMRMSPADPGSEPLLACDGQPRAGLVLGWVNSNGGLGLIPAGEHHLFRLCLDLVEGAPVRPAGLLDFLFCLDPSPGFPVANSIVLEDTRTVPLLPVPTAFAIENFKRGDANDDGAFDIGDPVRIFVHVFLTGDSIGCEDAADANDDGVLDLTDGVVLLDWRFLGGAPPAAPFPACGRDPTDEAAPLGCEIYVTCK